MPQGEKVAWNNYCNTQSVFLRDSTKTRTVAHRCHGKNKNITAKPKTSRKNQKPHGKNKNLTAKPKTSRQNQMLQGKNQIPWNTSRQKQILTAKPKLFCFCCEVFGFAVRANIDTWYFVPSRDVVAAGASNAAGSCSIFKTKSEDNFASFIPSEVGLIGKSSKVAFSRNVCEGVDEKGAVFKCEKPPELRLRQYQWRNGSGRRFSK